jgi:hypothetical protein
MAKLKFIDMNKVTTKKRLYFLDNQKSKEVLPFVQSEKLLGFLSKKSSDSKIIYDRFYSDLNIYHLKIPNSNCKKILEQLISRNLIFIGKNLSNLKTGNIGAFTLKDSKLSGIILDVSELNINIQTGESESIDLPYYASYFEYIRAVVNLNGQKISKDTKLNTSIIHYLSLMFIKMLASNITLNDKQKIFLECLVSYFYLRFLLNQNHNKVKFDIIETLETKELKSEFKFLSEKLDKYNSFKDIYKAFLDYNLFNEPPSVLLMKSLNKVSPFIFYNLTSTLDYLIALIVLSNYSFKLTSNSNINSGIQTQVENDIIKYSTNVNYDLSLNEL